jgi:hypothetical protein
VDADALFTIEKLSPAAPSTFIAVVLVVLFRFEACLTRDMVDMVASSVSSRALGETGAQGSFGIKCETSRRVPIPALTRAPITVMSACQNRLLSLTEHTARLTSAAAGQRSRQS